MKLRKIKGICPKCKNDGLLTERNQYLFLCSSFSIVGSSERYANKSRVLVMCNNTRCDFEENVYIDFEVYVPKKSKIE